ncbi:MAG TPA: DUF58 domain-containing protein [Planctomycetota bacterium]|nr:DUF58 domain-containing protein [Planctomycetota bacterium]
MPPALLEPDFLKRLGRLEIAARRVRRGVRRGERLSKRRGSSVEFADHRPYGAGDDLRFLDWSIYARLDRLMLKLFHDEEDLAVHLVVDASASMGCGEPTKLLYGLRVAAAIGYVALAGQCRVRATILRAPDRAESPGFLRGMGSSERLLGFLGGAEAAGPNALRGGIRRLLLETRPRGVVVLVSDLMDRDGVDDALGALGRSTGDLYAIQVLDPFELEPELDGEFRLVDSEDGSRADVSATPEVMKAYRARLDAYLGAVDGACRRRGIRRLLAPTSVPFEALVLDVLRSRGLLR